MQALYTNVFSTGPILLVPDPYSGQFKTNDAAESLIDWFIDTDYKIYSTQHFRIDHSSSKSSTYYEVKNNFNYYAIITQDVEKARKFKSSMNEALTLYTEFFIRLNDLDEYFLFVEKTGFKPIACYRFDKETLEKV